MRGWYGCTGGRHIHHNPPIPQDGEGPARAVTLDPLCMDVHEVSNEQFAQFVEATGYVTEVSSCLFNA